MKFYVTVEGVQKLKKSFLNLKLFSIIDVQEILLNHGVSYDSVDDYGIFIVSDHILSLIKTYSKSKRIRGIIYSNPNINEEAIENLKEYIKELDSITEFVLIDDYNVPKLRHFYHLFNEIVYFPSIRKIRLIECKSIKDKIDWKI